MAYTRNGDKLEYTELVLIGKKKIGVDEKGKDIIDAFYTEKKNKSRQMPPKVSDDELNNMVNEILFRSDTSWSIYDKWMVNLLSEVRERRNNWKTFLPIEDTILDMIIDTYMYVYIDKVKSFTGVNKLSAMLELKEYRNDTSV
jgi:hypothetical protein